MMTMPDEQMEQLMEEYIRERARLRYNLSLLC